MKAIDYYSISYIYTNILEHRQHNNNGLSRD